MRFGDYFLLVWRMRVAARWIPRSSRILDIGCYQGELLKWLGPNIAPSVGLDPLYEGKTNVKGHQFLAEKFREDLPFASGSFDAIVLLATLEHIQEKDAVAREAVRLLKPGGRLVITVPSPLVDKILDILLVLRVVDGMSLEEHHGFSPAELPEIFTREGFRLKRKQKFQLGLNNLYVFERL